MPNIKFDTVDEVKLLPIWHTAIPITDEAQIAFANDLKGNSQRKKRRETIIIRHSKKA